MEIVLPDRATRPESVVQCPLCKGNRRRVNPGYQRIDPNCELCHGTGIVDRDHTCVCGRALLLADEGVVYGDVYCCGRQECFDKLKPAAPKLKAPKREFVPDEYLGRHSFHDWDNWDDRTIEQYFMHACG